MANEKLNRGVYRCKPYTIRKVCSVVCNLWCQQECLALHTTCTPWWDIMLAPVFGIHLLLSKGVLPLDKARTIQVIFIKWLFCTTIPSTENSKLRQQSFDTALKTVSSRQFKQYLTSHNLYINRSQVLWIHVYNAIFVLKTRHYDSFMIICFLRRRSI